MPRLHHYTLPAIAAMLAVLLLLAGCGKKGPLYLPDSPRTPDYKQFKN